MDGSRPIVTTSKGWVIGTVWSLLLGGLLGRAEGWAQTENPLSAPASATTVLLDQADVTVLGELERAQALLGARQWEEAIRSLRELVDRAGTKLVAVAPCRFLPLRDYVQWLFSRLPPEGLAVYRRQVDGLAQRWYEQGCRGRESLLLRRVVEEYFASSWGDEALWLLGEIALEAGQYGEARWYWERLLAVRQPGEKPENPWLAYPDPGIEAASVRARLIWVSILEGSYQRAQEEWEQFVQLHPEARGRLAGREVRWGEALAEMLREAPNWPKCKPSQDWPTFGGTFARGAWAGRAPALGPVQWRVPLPPCPASSTEAGLLPSVAEHSQKPLAYFPVVVGRWVFINTLWEILGWEAGTGKSLWGQGRLYQDPLDPWAREALTPSSMWGTPRCTLTVYGDRLYARMGSPVTSWGQEGKEAPVSGYLVCLDLGAEGRLLWKVSPEEKQWAFEGSPVVDGRSVYVAMRRNEPGPHVQTYVSCLDAETGRMRWRTFICGGEPPVRSLPQTTHHLLSMEGDTLYYNTSLGAIAALNKVDGRLRWVRLYPRVGASSTGGTRLHWARQLTPCLYDRGVVYAAPADHPSVFALDAATGMLLWQTGPEVEDGVHLLGVWEDRLIVTGRRVYGIATHGPQRGQVVFRWPEGPEHLGYGRGVLAEGRIYWPTRHAIHMVDARTGRPIREFLLRPLGTGGGNLLVTADQWILATENELLSLGPGGLSEPTSPSQPALTAQEGNPLVPSRSREGEYRFILLRPEPSGSEGFREESNPVEAKIFIPQERPDESGG